jgi:monoamine oxidase
MKKKIYDVVIVGAGMSGLSAAYEAKQKGLSYIVLDARDRLGGRVYSHKLKSGLVIERGGEWLGKTHKELLAFCKKHAIKLEPHRYKHSRYFLKDGTEFASFEDLLGEFEAYVKNLKLQSIPVDEDWYSFLKDKYSEQEMKMIASVYGTDYGTHMRYVGARDAFTELVQGGDTDHLDYHVVGGNLRIIETMVKEVQKKNVKLSTEVKTINDHGDDVEVTTTKGVFYGKKVLLTVALPEIKELEIKPALKEKKDIARSVRYGDITKAFVSFKGNLSLKKQGFSMLTETDMPYVFLATQGQSEKRFALCVYAIGPLAKKVHHMRHDVLAKKLKAVLPRDTFNVEALELEEVVVQNWGTDRYTKGAYCYYGPGKHERVRAAFGEPHGNLHFAGAYLGHMSGYMNGAFQSGRDTMREIAKLLK